MRADQQNSGRIAVQQLTKRFGLVEAVHELSFTVQPGTVTGLLGLRGSGRSTTLRALLGLVAPTSGSATIGDVRYAELPAPARLVGAVLDGQGFHLGRTARDHLRCYAAAIELPDSRVDHVLRLTGLAECARLRVGGFSPDMRRRLALGTALLGDPRVLVLDEPIGDLDPAGVEWLRQFVRDFANRGGTVLVTGDRLTPLEGTVDGVVLLRAGGSVYQGGLESLLDAQRTQVLVACADPAALAIALAGRGVTEIDALPDGRISIAGATPRQVGETALEARVAVYGLVEHRTGLEQVFLDLVAGSAWPAPRSATSAAAPAPS